MTSFSGRRASRRAARGRLEAELLELLALLAQVEEQLALRLRGADLHEPPVVQDELEDVRADPERGVARQLDAAIRVELRHGLDEADVPFLTRSSRFLCARRYSYAIFTTSAGSPRSAARRGGVAVLDERDASAFSSSGVSSG
jgi:hypothetical protein